KHVKSELYLDEFIETKGEGELDELKKRNVVGIDPNKGNLLYCIDEHDKILRYTQGQRKFETKQKKYKTYEEEFTTEQHSNGKTIKEWETLLSAHDSKTLD